MPGDEFCNESSEIVEGYINDRLFNLKYDTSFIETIAPATKNIKKSRK